MGRRTASDRYRFDIIRDGPAKADLKAGLDEVVVRARDRMVDHIRMSLIRAEVGDDNPNESGNFPGQDKGLAVRLQAQDRDGLAFGPVSRFDDEGIVFRTQSRDMKFDIRDVNEASIDRFDVAVLGTSRNDRFDYRDEKADFYVHGGYGDDRITGGRGDDYLIGGFGNDRVKGGQGDDVLVGGPGVDRIEGGAGDDMIVYRPGLDGADQVDLGRGYDVVSLLGAPGEIRLTLSTLQIGNNDPNDSGALNNEDGGLNIRLQSEDASGNLVGPVSRYDDEGISFVGTPGITFDIRNLPDGMERGSGYSTARFGSHRDDVYDDSASSGNVFHNGGRGDDWLIGGSGADHLVGLDGDDRLEGGLGDDLLVGLAGSDTFVFTGDPGRDTILTYEPGVDRIDLSAYGIGIDNVEATQTGPNTLIRVDSDADGTFDFEIFLGGSVPPVFNDYMF